MLQSRWVFMVRLLNPHYLNAMLYAMALGAWAIPALAECQAGSQVLVSCTLKGGAKQLDTCLMGDQALYRYGPRNGAPELELRHHVRDVDMQPWPGVSRTIWEGFTFFNKDLGYEVYYSIDKGPELTDIRGGITVLRGDKTLASLECDPGSVISSGYSLPLYEAKEAAGQCWDHSQFAWVSC